MNDDLERQIGELVATKGFVKDTKPHFIKPEYVRPASITGPDFPYDNTKQTLPDTAVESMSAILKRIDENTVDEARNRYVQLLQQESAEIVERLRHRATMLRQRAEELDVNADVIEQNRLNVFSMSGLIAERMDDAVNDLMKLAHIEPEKVKP